MKSDYNWLDSWVEVIKRKSVLELGAGPGIDTETIRANAKSVIATDIKPSDALSIEELDHSKPLPYKSNSFDIIVASLCLHYFKWSTTEKVVGRSRFAEQNTIHRRSQKNN